MSSRVRVKTLTLTPPGSMGGRTRVWTAKRGGPARRGGWPLDGDAFLEVADCGAVLDLHLHRAVESPYLEIIHSQKRVRHPPLRDTVPLSAKHKSLSPASLTA
jgi:hypothetical protein